MPKSISVERHIDAPVEDVFEVVAHCDRFAEAIPAIDRVELLSEKERGVGVRFRETRVMKGREAATELEVTEYEAPNHVRIVADSHGAIWDSVFTVEPSASGSLLRLKMDARPHGMTARVLTPIAMMMIGPALEGDMDAVKAYCESAKS